jgi:mono/diheme cytochrome c family protein
MFATGPGRAPGGTTTRAVAAFLLLPALLLTLAFPAAPARGETAVERGAYLVNGVAACGNCHTKQEPDGTPAGPALAGGAALVLPAFTSYPPNITPDRETGIGAWSEEQIVTALRDGRRPDGRLLRPPMPIVYYQGLSDRDAHAIAAYLRTIAPIHNQVPASIYHADLPTDYGAPAGHIPDPDPRDRRAYGAYIARLAHCMECHTPRDAHGVSQTATQLGAGGLVLGGIFGERTAANITQDRLTGIGAWTDAQIEDAIRSGVRPDGSLLASPMPWRYFAAMRDADLDALVTYLRTVPPVRNAVR